MTMHKATQRPPTFNAYQYLGDVTELQTVLTNATPPDAPYTFTATAQGGDALITTTYYGNEGTVTVPVNDWLVWSGDAINSPSVPLVSDTDVTALYVIDPPDLGA